MVGYHGRKDIEHYILSVMNIVSLICCGTRSWLVDSLTRVVHMSDFVSFLLFWRSGCQTLSWCQSGKCCEHHSDPVDCSHRGSGKRTSSPVLGSFPPPLRMMHMNRVFQGISMEGQSRQIIHHMATSSDERHTHASSLRESRLRIVHALYMCICDGKNSVLPHLLLTSTSFMEVWSSIIGEIFDY